MNEFNKDRLTNYIINDLNGISLNVDNTEVLLEQYNLTYDNIKNNNHIVTNLLNTDPDYFEKSKHNCFNIIKTILNQHLTKEESSSSTNSTSDSSANSTSSSDSSYINLYSNSESKTSEYSDNELKQNKELEIIIPVYHNHHYCTCSLKFIEGKKIIYEIIDPKGTYNNENLGKQIIEGLRKDKELNNLFRQYSSDEKNVIFEPGTGYSKRISKKQYDNTSCGYYMITVINDITSQQNNIISKNKVKEQIEPNQEEDKKIQTKVLEKLNIEELIKFYGNCTENGKTKTKPDLDFIFEIANNENIQNNCYNITVNNTEYSIISLNGNQYFIGEDNKIYQLIISKENIKIIECFDCNKEIISYINEKYFEKKLEKVNIKTLNQITKKDFCKEFVYTIIKNNFDKEVDEKCKKVITSIPTDIKVEFLKEFGKEENVNEIAQILNINIEEKVLEDIITSMCNNLNREDIKKIFEINNDSKFYEEFYSKQDNNNSKRFIYCCILKSNNIEGIKSQLINNFDNFINNKNELFLMYNNIQDQKIDDIEDLKRILNDLEFRKEFKAKNPNKNILDIYNAYMNNNGKTYIKNTNKNIELSTGDFYFGDKIDQLYNKDLLLKNNNFVVVNAGNTKGTFAGSTLNQACCETYNLNKQVKIFQLKKGKTKNGVKCLKQIEKNTCSILEIKKNKQKYKMIYLTGPELSGNDINKLDKALNAYLKALQDENLNNMTILFSGISNNLYAGNYAKYIKNYNGNSFNIVEFYTALYFKTHSNELEKKKCNIIYTNGISYAMDYINNILKVSKNKISIDEILSGFDIKNNDIIYTEIENMLKKCNFVGIDYTKKQNTLLESNIPVLENQDTYIGNVQRDIINSIRIKTKDNNFSILTLVNTSDNDGYTKTLLDLKTECTNVIKECDTDLKRKTDLYIIADTINKVINEEEELKKEDANVKEVLDISCKEILNNEQYKKNHDSMRCNNIKFDGNSLSFHISHGSCKDANIKFNIPTGFSKEQIFVLIGCYGLNSVIKTFNKEGNCEINYNGQNYYNINDIEMDNILNKSFECANKTKLQELENALDDFENAIGQSMNTTQLQF